MVKQLGISISEADKEHKIIEDELRIAENIEFKNFLRKYLSPPGGPIINIIYYYGSSIQLYDFRGSVPQGVGVIDGRKTNSSLV